MIRRPPKFHLFPYPTLSRSLFDVTCAIPRRAVTALIGPSGCGKSTFLRSVNRLNELTPHTRHAGDILLEGVSVFSKGDRKSTRLNSSHLVISYAVFCLKKKKKSIR